MFVPIVAGAVAGLFAFFVAQPQLISWNKRRAEEWRARRIDAGRSVPPADEWTWYQRFIVAFVIISIPVLLLGFAMRGGWFATTTIGVFVTLMAVSFVWQRFLRNQD